MVGDFALVLLLLLLEVLLGLVHPFIGRNPVGVDARSLTVFVVFESPLQVGVDEDEDEK